MVERESDSEKRRVGGRENKGNLEGEIDEYLEEENTGWKKAKASHE